MPPIKTYMYKSLVNDRVEIVIMAYSEQSALNQLEKIVKFPNQFKLIYYE